MEKTLFRMAVCIMISAPAFFPSFAGAQETSGSISQTAVSDPRPDIKVNGADSSVSIEPETAISLTISLDAEKGENADWWVAVSTPFGWFYMDISAGSIAWKQGLCFTYQGPLFDFSSFEVLNLSGLPEGDYVFYFAVDMSMNGTIAETDSFYYDSVNLNISASGASYPIADTGQTACYNSSGTLIICPHSGASFYGQDAQYAGLNPAYTDNGDGTVTDNNTGLMWQKNPGAKMTYDAAVAGASSFNLAGYTDWRLPTIKELYSLIHFNGTDPSGMAGDDTSGLTPFINTDYFGFEYGDTGAGERIIDSQWATDTIYKSTTMRGTVTMFGVNFADGRIKGYPRDNKTYFVLYVRGNTEYGMNAFSDRGDGTVKDGACGLLWQQDDSGPYQWEDALAYCEALELAGRDDWRLPNAKELQSIVDYTRSPDTSGSAAIDPLFSVTSITNEAGQTDYPFYWTGTTHANYTGIPGGNAVYVAFGRALGSMNGQWMDVHGAGAQRSDPKTGDPDDYPTGHGPQGDAIRIYNYVRCVCDDN